MKNHTSKKSGQPATSRTQEAAPPRGSSASWIWPVAVTGLIILGMGWTFGLLYFSRVDGGPRVIEDYYDKAVRWDALRAEATADSLASRSALSDSSAFDTSGMDTAQGDSDAPVAAGADGINAP
jgi:hypothetical protein